MCRMESELSPAQIVWGLGLAKMCYENLKSGLVHDTWHDGKAKAKGGDKKGS